TREVAPGPQYGAGGFHRMMLGASYRKLWTTPVQAEVLDLATEAGGLTVVKRVGGQQTLGLALAGKDGRSYTFRGLDKDPTNILPEELQDSFVEDLVRDQMSAQHPAGALVADELARAAGVPTVPIRLVVLPDDPALGDERATFAGLLGTFSEYPTAADARHPGFEGAVEIVDHVTLYAKLAESPDERVAGREFLRARLFDLFVSDFDRHRKQWRWAKRPGDTLWHPIPEDRDQAFARYEGLVVRAAAGYVPQLRTFGKDYDHIFGMTYNGREQDRWLLPELSREAWREVAADLKARITDEAIERASRRLPPEWYAIDGPRLAAALKARRDKLPEAADRFYRHLAGQVDVQCTNAAEIARVRRMEGGAVEVQVARRQEDGTAATPYFSRRFVPGETAEVRLYLRGGNDRVVSEGRDGGVTVRVVGGRGDDVVDDSRGGGTRFYDTEGVNRAVEGGGTRFDTRPYEPPPGPKNAPWIPPRDWGRDWFPLPWASYSSDYGVFLGGGFATRSYGFRQRPFASQHALRVGWAFGASQPKVSYDGDFHRANSRSLFGVTAYYSGLEVLRYYGSGNETVAAEDDDFNKVRQRQVVFAPTLTLPLGGPLSLTVAPVVQYAKTEEGQRLVDEEQPYGYGEFGQAGGRAVLRLDTRRPLGGATRTTLQLPLRGGAGAYPVSGFYVEAIGQVFPKAWDVEEAYGWVEGNASTYLTAGSKGRVTLALRGGGKHMLGGKYPFHNAATVGGGGFFSGQDAVRGFHPNRFIGDSAVWGNADLRLYLSRFFLALPGEWGLFGFGDVGRVWLEGETSDTWHTGWGGGLWIGLLSRSNAVAFTVAKSDERTAFYVRAGFSF
ncbi:MAG TPA: hypothetical protein VGB87_22110, partial [Vicinamibacteria bacterium]